MPDYSSQSSKKLNEDGSKARQNEDKEDRSLLYRDFRRTVNDKVKNKKLSCYTSDIDQIEYVIKNGEVIPAAVLELTRYDFDENTLKSESWHCYHNSIINRYFFRDAQGKFIRKMAQLLNVPAYIVLFRYDLESFWLFNLNVTAMETKWEHKTKEEYKQWLFSLKDNTGK